MISVFLGDLIWFHWRVAWNRISFIYLNNISAYHSKHCSWFTHPPSSLATPSSYSLVTRWSMNGCSNDDLFISDRQSGEPVVSINWMDSRMGRLAFTSRSKRSRLSERFSRRISIKTLSIDGTPIFFEIMICTKTNRSRFVTGVQLTVCVA